MYRIFMFLVLFCTNIEVQANVCTVDFTLINNDKEYIEYWFVNENGEDRYGRLMLNSDVQFLAELIIPSKQLISFGYGNEFFEMLLAPGMKVELTMDGTDVLNSLSFGGDGADDNNFLVGYTRQFGFGGTKSYRLACMNIYLPNRIVQWVSDMDMDLYYSKLDHIRKSASQYIEMNKSKVSELAFDLINSRHFYDDLVGRLAYVIVKSEGLSLIDIIKIKDAYPQKLYQNPKGNALDDYHNYLKVRAYYDFLPNVPSASRYDAPLVYDLMAVNYEGLAKSYLQSQLILDFTVCSNESQFGIDRYEDFMKNNPTTRYTSRIETLLGAENKNNYANIAPDFEFMTLEGIKANLSDYRGKVVYLSFWASWCKPCIDGFRKYKNLRNDLEEMGIVLLNVSIDDNEIAYQDAVLKYNTQGINAKPILMDETKILYELSSIPAYYIVDKDGKFAYLSDTKGRDIKAEFRALLNR